MQNSSKFQKVGCVCVGEYEYMHKRICFIKTYIKSQGKRTQNVQDSSKESQTSSSYSSRYQKLIQSYSNQYSAALVQEFKKKNKYKSRLKI